MMLLHLPLLPSVVVAVGRTVHMPICTRYVTYLTPPDGNENTRLHKRIFSTRPKNFPHRLLLHLICVFLVCVGFFFTRCCGALAAKIVLFRDRQSRPWRRRGRKTRLISHLNIIIRFGCLLSLRYPMSTWIG